MTPEGDLKWQAKEYFTLRSDDVFYVPVDQGTYGKVGDPDMIICYRGLFVGMEFKSYSGRLRNLQKIRHRQIEKAGGLWIKPTCLQDIKNLFDELDKTLGR